MLFILVLQDWDLISLLIYQSHTIFHSEYTAGAMCQSPVQIPGDWKKVWLSGVGVGGLQWRVQFLTHLDRTMSAPTLFYQVQRPSSVYDVLE